jgi:hypothetical protein
MLVMMLLKRKLMVSQKVFLHVIARSKAMKQSPKFKLLQPMRLLRYARNDINSDFL